MFLKEYRDWEPELEKGTKGHPMELSMWLMRVSTS